MPKFCDLTGKRFGRLVVIEHAGRNANKRQIWKCLCDCGATHVADSAALTRANTRSCGCYLKERITKHGGTGKASYNTWRAMMRRCYSPNDKDYQRYGARGITVCGAWHTYTAFVADMGEPTGAQTLDRIDLNGSYTPSNCRWASPATQARNTRVKSNKSGHRGIWAVKPGMWLAYISAGRKKYYGKCRTSLAKALDDRKELERMHWGEN